MPDVVGPTTRSRMMSGIRGKNTKPELVIRRQLHSLGFRYRIHYKTLPGKPDMVFPKYKALILVHGCFWHVHDCHLFKWPHSRETFWHTKLVRNKALDKEHIQHLCSLGWRTLVIWECALKGRSRLPLNEVVERAKIWLLSDEPIAEIRGNE